MSKWKRLLRPRLTDLLWAVALILYLVIDAKTQEKAPDVCSLPGSSACFLSEQVWCLQQKRPKEGDFTRDLMFTACNQGLIARYAGVYPWAVSFNGRSIWYLVPMFLRPRQELLR